MSETPQAVTEERVRAFFKETLETREFYVLVGEEGEPLVTESNEFADEEGNPLVVVPFWSKSNLSEGKKWAESEEVDAIILDEFIENWVPAMIEDNIAIGLNWDDEGMGFECSPEEFLEMYDDVENGKPLEFEPEESIN